MQVKIEPRCRKANADYAKLVADETEKWGKVVKASGATAE
jgi:hypothetical protein